MHEGTLVASSNSGRYAVDDEQGPPYTDITSGQVLRGSVEHAPYLYSIESIGRPAQRGYYFQARDGGRCGLVVGMRVRLL
jgi:hypothetical protein